MEMLTVTNPQTNEVLANLTLSTADEISILVEKSKEGQKVWAKKSLYERSCILYKFADILENQATQLAAILTKEMGKVWRMSLDEVKKVPQNIRSTVEYANHMYGKVLLDNDSDTVGDLVFTKNVPLGLIASIIPFNYPVEATVLKVIPALIMGNSVIVKAPSSNPMAVLALQGMLVEAGVPKDIIPFIVCSREASNISIIKNPEVNAISMTGSTYSGIQVATDSIKQLKPLFLELGGNDPFIICDDVNIDEAVNEIIEGRLYNAGQTCCAPKRLLVDRKICSTLTEALIERLKKVVVGDAMDPATDLATLVTEKAAKSVEAQVQQTVDAGAVIAFGGKRKGAYYDPTVLTGVTKDMEIAKDLEIFGPVFPVIPFDTVDEAIAIANQSVFGLNAGVLSKDTMEAFYIANRLETGTVVVNGHSAYRHLEAAHGGVKMSGLGREGVYSSLSEFSEIKTYVLKRAMK